MTFSSFLPPPLSPSPPLLPPPVSLSQCLTETEDKVISGPRPPFGSGLSGTSPHFTPYNFPPADCSSQEIPPLPFPFQGLCSRLCPTNPLACPGRALQRTHMLVRHMCTVSLMRPGAPVAPREPWSRALWNHPQVLLCHVPLLVRRWFWKFRVDPNYGRT